MTIFPCSRGVRHETSFFRLRSFLFSFNLFSTVVQKDERFCAKYVNWNWIDSVSKWEIDKAAGRVHSKKSIYKTKQHNPYKISFNDAFDTNNSREGSENSSWRFAKFSNNAKFYRFSLFFCWLGHYSLPI